MPGHAQTGMGVLVIYLSSTRLCRENRNTKQNINNNMKTKTIILKKKSTDKRTQQMFRGSASDIATLFSQEPKAIVPIRHGLDVETMDCIPGEEPEGFRAVDSVAAELLDVPVSVIKPWNADNFLRGNLGPNQVVYQDLLVQHNLASDLELLQVRMLSFKEQW